MTQLLPLLRANFGAIALAALTASASAQGNGPVTLVVGYPAGGATDIVARLLERPLGRELGQPVVVKNVAGAAGTIGASEVARAPADGSTLMLTPIGPVAFLPYLRKVNYDRASFAPICRIVDAPVVMMTARASGLKSMADAVAAAKANPGGLPFASTGEGTLPHLSQLAWARGAGVDVLHVPYKGSGEVVTALKGGTVALFNDQISVAAQHDLQPLLVFSEARQPRFPDVPTARELGMDLSFSIWSGLYAPSRTPPETLARLEAACQAALADPGVRESMMKAGQAVAPLGARAFGELTERDGQRMQRVIAEAGLKPQQ